MSWSDLNIQELFNTVQAGLLLCGQDCRPVLVNGIARDFFNKAGLEMTDQPCHKALLGSDARCEGCPADGEEQAGKCQALTLKGRDGDIYLKVFCQPWQGRYLLTIHEITQEITLRRRSDLDRKELQAKNILLERRRSLNQEEQEFVVQLMDNLPDALLAVDEGFLVQWQNSAVQDFFPGQTGNHCYTRLGHHDGPCPDCPARDGFREANGKKKSRETAGRIYTEIFSVAPNGKGGMLLFRDITRQVDLIERIRAQREEIDRNNKMLSLVVDFGAYLQKENDVHQVADYFLDTILPNFHAGAAAIIVNDIRAGHIWLSRQRGVPEPQWKAVAKACLARDLQKFKVGSLLADKDLPWRQSGQIPLVGAQGQRVGLVLLEGEAGAEELHLLRLVAESLGAYFQNQLLLRQLEDKANRDTLTGLFNRGYLEQALEEEQGKFDLYGLHHALVLGDINQLKRLNDQYGHEIGDQLIIAVARALRKNLRNTDIAARTGGDEFIVLLTNSTEEEAGNFVARLQGEVFSGLHLPLPDGKKFPVTISLGKAGTDRHPPELLMKEADKQMYAAKKEFYETTRRYR